MIATKTQSGLTAKIVASLIVGIFLSCSLAAPAYAKKKPRLEDFLHINLDQYKAPMEAGKPTQRQVVVENTSQQTLTDIVLKISYVAVPETNQVVMSDIVLSDPKVVVTSQQTSEVKLYIPAVPAGGSETISMTALIYHPGELQVAVQAKTAEMIPYNEQKVSEVQIPVQDIVYVGPSNLTAYPYTDSYMAFAISDSYAQANTEVTMTASVLGPLVTAWGGATLNDVPLNCTLIPAEGNDRLQCPLKLAPSNNTVVTDILYTPGYQILDPYKESVQIVLAGDSSSAQTSAEATVIPSPSVCGNAACESGETPDTCPADCQL